MRSVQKRIEYCEEHAILVRINDGYPHHSWGLVAIEIVVAIIDTGYEEDWVLFVGCFPSHMVDAAAFLFSY